MIVESILIVFICFICLRFNIVRSLRGFVYHYFPFACCKVNAKYLHVSSSIFQFHKDSLFNYTFSLKCYTILKSSLFYTTFYFFCANVNYIQKLRFEAMKIFRLIDNLIYVVIVACSGCFVAIRAVAAISIYIGALCCCYYVAGAGAGAGGVQPYIGRLRGGVRVSPLHINGLIKPLHINGLIEFST